MGGRRDPLGFVEAELEALRSAGLYRDPAFSRWTPELLNLCSNDYLGYAGLPWPQSPGAASGAGAARMVTGSHRAHEEAESAISAWLGFEAALLYTSGYAANVGLISALAGPGDLIVSDALNHASIIDGCRLSRATVAVVPHADPDAVARALGARARRRFVVTESIFSMEGDSPDLPRLREVADHHDAALIVDEAHALGVVGPSGTGRSAELGVRPDALVGTCGKALGLQGAFVASSARLRDWLWNRSRSFVFSTATSPALSAAIAVRVGLARADDAARARVGACATALRGVIPGLRATCLETPVIPWILGSPESAQRAAAALLEQGILVRPIRPPTVPQGTARLRITASAGLGGAALERALLALASAVGRFT